METAGEARAGSVIERVQLGVRVEKRMVKVLKALAALNDSTLGELLEDIVAHAFEGHSTFDSPEAQAKIRDFQRLYGLEQGAHTVYGFRETVG
ncbi:hypothetical protein [Deinococcus sp.]|uniref:hypothetical protein n=1 Tax=Deinococcus sp. TaxID=47478 RepID=UPI003C7A7174